MGVFLGRSQEHCNFRENKNRYVFSFLAALVDMQIVASVEIVFMLVGHTGNQVEYFKYLKK